MQNPKHSEGSRTRSETKSADNVQTPIPPRESVRPTTASRNEEMSFVIVLTDLARLFNRPLRSQNLAPSTRGRSASRATIAASVLNGPTFGGHAASFPGVDELAEVPSLLVILICPMIAGRALRATRALPRRPRTENFSTHILEAVPADEVFVPGAGPPSCTPSPQPSGWSPTRTTPTTNNRRKHGKTKGEGKPGSWKNSQSQHPQMSSASSGTP